MAKGIRRRFWFELTIALIASGLALLTFVTRDWIEVLFGVDPDEGSGMLEWGLVVFAVVMSFAARREYRHRTPLAQ
jgi:hypothetical protein